MANIDVVTTTHAALSDERTPLDGSVTAAKLNSSLGSATGLIAGSNTATYSGVTINSAQETLQVLGWFSGGSPRWYFRCSAEAETGSNAGSNLNLLARADSGANVGTVLSFNRATGSATFTGSTLTNNGNMVNTGVVSSYGGAALGSVGGGQTFLSLDSAAGNFRLIQFNSAGIARWHVRATNAAESGSNTGSDFQIVSRTDAGSPNITVIDINRATGTTTFGGALQTVASKTSLTGFRLPHGSAPNSPVNGDVWTTTAGLYVRINGTTVGPLSA